MGTVIQLRTGIGNATPKKERKIDLPKVPLSVPDEKLLALAKTELQHASAAYLRSLMHFASLNARAINRVTHESDTEFRKAIEQTAQPWLQQLDTIWSAEFETLLAIEEQR